MKAATSHPTTAPRKRFGQHFLADESIVRRIVDCIAPAPGEVLVEIGPGRGALTFPLLERAGSLIAIELDRDLANWLSTLSASTQGALKLIQADALTVDFSALSTGKLRLVGNLPYNISTPLLFHALEHAPHIADMHFMLQKEVVDRMAAAAGGRTFGRLSVMLQARCSVQPLLQVPPSAFEPPPKVESAVVRLVPLPAAGVADIDFAALDRVVRSGFAQRRKTLRNALAGVVSERTLEDNDIDPAARAETVPVSAWLRLAQAIGQAESPARTAALESSGRNADN